MTVGRQCLTYVKPRRSRATVGKQKEFGGGAGGWLDVRRDAAHIK